MAFRVQPGDAPYGPQTPEPRGRRTRAATAEGSRGDGLGRGHVPMIFSPTLDPDAPGAGREVYSRLQRFNMDVAASINELSEGFEALLARVITTENSQHILAGGHRQALEELVGHARVEFTRLSDDANQAKAAVVQEAADVRRLLTATQTAVTELYNGAAGEFTAVRGGIGQAEQAVAALRSGLGQADQAIAGLGAASGRQQLELTELRRDLPQAPSCKGDPWANGNSFFQGCFFCVSCTCCGCRYPWQQTVMRLGALTIRSLTRLR